MPRNRFLQPATTRLALSDGDWVEVKTELTYGEALELSAASHRREGELGGEWVQRFYLRRAAIWLEDWSFQNGNGRKVELAGNVEEREIQLGSLDSDTGRELDIALTQHEEQIRRGKDTPAAVAPPEIVTMSEGGTLILRAG